jgi:hypothetical protein
MPGFKGVFIAVFLGAALVVAALIVNSERPVSDTSRGSASFTKATGKCAECHRQETAAIVAQYEASKHADVGVSCLECHRPLEGQESVDHRGFEITQNPTAKNCAQCHATEYEQFTKSRHAASAWAAVRGSQDFTAEQIAFGEKYHEGMIDRPANALALLEGDGAISSGCASCHDIGKPNADGSIGTCTACHSRHNASVALAREPRTCGQCHMGPDHSQLEIYEESKHGVLFNSQKHLFDLSAPSDQLSSADLPVPTCSTCHMSGIDGLKVTHDTTERLSWTLYAPISKKRTGYQRGQDEMQETCKKCHASTGIEAMYAEAEIVVESTNKKVAEMKQLMQGLRDDGLLTPEPFDEPIEFLAFDFWHYYGRTAKHGAFMGGADFVQWHGNYELLALMVEMKEMAHEIRKQKG